MAENTVCKQIMTVPTLPILQMVAASRDPLLTNALVNGEDLGLAAFRDVSGHTHHSPRDEAVAGWCMLNSLTLEEALAHGIYGIDGIFLEIGLKELTRLFMEEHPELIKARDIAMDSVQVRKDVMCSVVQMIQMYCPDVQAEVIDGTTLSLSGTEKALLNTSCRIAAYLTEAVSKDFSVDGFALFGPVTYDKGTPVSDDCARMVPTPASQSAIHQNADGRLVYNWSLIRV